MNRLRKPVGPSSRTAAGFSPLVGFLRLITSRRVFENPIRVSLATRHVRSWLERPQVQVLHPGARHAEILFGFLDELGTAASLTTDTHVAAIAI